MGAIELHARASKDFAAKLQASQGVLRHAASEFQPVIQASSLGAEDVVMITELECQVPGCPPLETVIAFWCEDEKRRHLKVFKPLVEVVEDDLPPWWMKNALIYDDEIRCSCC